MTSSTSSSETPQARRAQFRALGVKIGLWLGLFLIANMLAREPVSRMIETPVRLQMDQIARHPGAPVVLLGDSHGVPLGDSDDHLLNLATGGDSLADMRARLSYLLRVGHPVRQVIVCLPWHSLSAGRALRNNRQQAEMFTDGASHQRIYQEPAWRFWARRQIFSRLPLLNPINGRLARRYLVHWLFPEPGSPPWTSLSADQRTAQARERALRNYGQPYDPQQVEQLKGLLADCRRAKIPLTAIRTPVSPEYSPLVLHSDEYLLGREAVARLGLEVTEWPVPAAEHFENQDHLRRGVMARNIREFLVRDPK